MTAFAGTTSTNSSPPQATHGLGYKIAWFLLNNSIIIALVVEVAIFALLGKDKFWNPAVLAIILQYASVVGIMLPFYTIAMISGNVDFSTIQVGSLAGVVFAVLLTGLNFPWWIAVIGAMGLTVIIGVLNSWIVLRLKIPSFVATIVGGSVAYGAAYMLAERYGQAMQVKVAAPAIRQLWLLKPLGLPLTVYLMFLCYIGVYILLNHTRLGAHLYAIGTNPDAALRSGINLRRLVIFVFMQLAVMVSAANIIYFARILNAGPFLSPAQMTSGAGIPVTLVAGLFAGIGLFGGTGRVEFTLIGLLFFAVLAVGMAVVGFPPQFRVAVDGASIILALVLDSVRRYLMSR